MKILTYEEVDEAMQNALENYPDIATWPAEQIMDDMMAYWEDAEDADPVHLLSTIHLWKLRHGSGNK